MTSGLFFLQIINLLAETNTIEINNTIFAALSKSIER